MSQPPFDRFARFVTNHSGLVLVLMLVLSAGMLVGAMQLDTESQSDEEALFPETDASDAAEYVEQHYGDDTEDRAVAAVYVREDDRTALTRESLLETLHYTQAVLENDSVAEALEAPPRSVAGEVAMTLADEPEPALSTQIDALETASDEEVEAAVADTLGPESESLALLPASHEPGTTATESHRLLFQFETDDGAVPTDVQKVLYEEAGERSAFFTLGEHAMADANETLNENTLQLVVPFALLFVVGILAVTYRDLVDIVVGLVGTVVAILWMFGILGWLGIGAGMTMIIGPVLVAGLSIDFSFHVFNRYREKRGPAERPGPPMARGIRSVGLALALVTVTAAVGFLANVVNPVAMIRDLGIGITLGVGAAFVIFLTLVPALSLTIDRVLERFGHERRRQPLGHGRFLEPILTKSVTIARYGAPIVLVIALIAGGAGAVAWTTLDEEQFQEQAEPAADWKQSLPGPLAWEDPDYNHDRQYVAEHYRAAGGGDEDRFQVLLEGDVTADGTLEAVAAGTDEPVFDAAGGTPVQSPVTVIQQVAAEDSDFAATVAAADTTGDGVPDTDLAAVYDHLFAVAPDRAETVIERTDGEYRSLRVLGPAESAGMQDDRTEEIGAAAAAMETDGVTATAVSSTIVVEQGLSTLTDGILQVLLLALGAVALTLVVVARLVHGSAVLGALTALPIALVVGLVVGGMALLSVPLTLVTALLMSLVVGLGIDYSIHISDRFAQQLERGQDGVAALETAVTGTGGALLGSAMTSSAAFLALLLHPHPQLESFGILVILALAAALLASVVVLPSLLWLWCRFGNVTDGEGLSTEVSDD